MGGFEVFQQPLVVGDDHEAAHRAAQAVDAFGHGFESINIKAAVGFVQDGKGGFEEGHLQDFEAFFLAAAKADVNVAGEEVFGDVQLVHFAAAGFEEFERVEFWQATRGAVGVDGGTEELRGVDAREFHRILEGEKQAAARAFVGFQLQQVGAVQRGLAVGDGVAIAPRQRIAQRAFAGAVGAHDGVDFARVDREGEAFQDGFFGFFNRNMEILEVEEGHGFNLVVEGIA